MKSLAVGAFTIGAPRKQNEDGFTLLALPNKTNILAIADGVGGSSSGLLSSKIAIETIEEWINSNVLDITLPFYRTDEKLKQLVNSNPSTYSSLATTLTMVKIINNLITFAHVGDCRAYLMRGAGLKTLTSDQTEVQKLVELGVLTKARLKDYKRSHVLLSALGSSRKFEIQTGDFRAQPGDRLLLCSDGLYNAISKRKLVNLSKDTEKLDEFLFELHKLTLSSPLSDDATVVAAQF
ncbi:protein phosphatase 2C domain-containing protein [Methylobacter sp. Wu1]|uniref:PP2C family protein-serine/threonine phosphatase n=1 Tax=Methylobacter sp. Wu1 TaxID=3119359 RepID=UPI002F9354D3